MTTSTWTTQIPFSFWRFLFSLWKYTIEKHSKNLASIYFLFFLNDLFCYDLQKNIFDIAFHHFLSSILIFVVKKLDVVRYVYLHFSVNLCILKLVCFSALLLVIFLILWSFIWLLAILFENMHSKKGDIFENIHFI